MEYFTSPDTFMWGCFLSLPETTPSGLLSASLNLYKTMVVCLAQPSIMSLKADTVGNGVHMIHTVRKCMPQQLCPIITSNRLRNIPPLPRYFVIAHQSLVIKVVKHTTHPSKPLQNINQN